MTINRFTCRTVAPVPTRGGAAALVTTRAPQWVTWPPSAQAPSLPALTTVRTEMALIGWRLRIQRYSNNEDTAMHLLNHTCYMSVFMSWVEVSYGHEWTEGFSCSLAGYLMASGGMHTLPAWVHSLYSCIFIKQNRWQEDWKIISFGATC